MAEKGKCKRRGEEKTSPPPSDLPRMGGDMWWASMKEQGVKNYEKDGKLKKLKKQKRRKKGISNGKEKKRHGR